MSAYKQHVFKDESKRQETELVQESIVNDQHTGDEHQIEGLETTFFAQKEAFDLNPHPDYKARLANLKILYRLIDVNADKLADALNKDFGCRVREESEIAEIIGSLSSIRYLMTNLKKFMRPDKRRISIWFQPAKGEVVLRPLGIVGVIAPWNYTLHLTIAPVAAALAAGNRVMAKMSESTPHTASLLKRLVSEAFPSDTLSIFDGGVDVAQAFSSLPFNHLLFTGSTNVGREIAKAAAKNLTPVTLELSGKSPVVIGKYYSVEEAANRVVWGKCFNAGQTCVAPDYIFVPRDKLLEFTRAARAAARRYFPEGIDKDNYTSIINQRHCQRINSLIDDAKANGVEVLPLLDVDISKLLKRNKIPPTLVLQPTRCCKIFDEEVFGPVLPVFVYDELSEVIDVIRLNSDPLALYVFSNHQDEISYISNRVNAGNVAINDTLLEYIQNDLPFGGVGKSGSGKYHGKEGFEAFSNKQAMFIQSGLGSFTGTKLLYPPYGKIAHLMLKILRRWP